MIARLPQAPALVPSARLGLVSVPVSDAAQALESAGAGPDRTAVRALLRDLGAALGLSMLERKESFPDDAPDGSDDAFGDDAVRRTLEGLDAVWMNAGEVVAVFAMESGLPGWEGARRLADLLALHPKLKAPLYAVTVQALESGLLAEINRPLFATPKRRLGESLRLLDWDRLREEVAQLGERVRYLKPEFLEGISEPAEPPREA